MMFDGAIAELDGDLDAAVATYREALAGFEEIETDLYAHVVRDRLGRLLGGDEGAAMRARTRAWLDAQAVTEPETMLEMLLPGCR